MRCYIALMIVILVATLQPRDCVASDCLPPVSDRLMAPGTNEVPDFQKHVVPLLGRLGCNGRACHGSFQGRGGFRLSLFGYDFKMDHEALTAESSSGEESRVDLDLPGKSLVIAKPSQQIAHEGGRRFEAGGWEHELLERWIAAGAQGILRPRELRHLRIEPSEVVFGPDADPVEVRVVAIWQDGAQEDVTPLCRFRTNDDSVMTVDQDGVVASVGPGDTHLIAFYDNGVAAIPVIRSIARVAEAQNDPSDIPRTKIDQFIQEKLNKLGIKSSPVCTDAEFLRRVSIDLTGTLPTPHEVESFLADDSAGKRNRKIDELLQRPAYAAWWANKLCDYTGCNPTQQAELGQDTSVQWYMWIYQRLRENTPYNDLVARIVLATGRDEGQTYDEYAADVSAYFRDDSPADFSDRQTMPHYWTRRSMEEPDDKALAFAHSFLGIQMQCAQCHKHPFAPWTQDDFKQFSKFFEPIHFGVDSESDERYREMAKEVGLNVRGKNGSAIRNDVLKHAQAGGTIPWRELLIEERSEPAKLSLLRSGVVEIAPDEDPRRPIMDWMSEPSNPWFARAFVNRVWAGYFHVGIVDPPDELNPANPPSNPRLLNWLTDKFIENEYNIKWLHRQIVTSDAYQRSWKANASNQDDRRNFSRTVPRRIPAEVVYDALKQAVAATDQLQQVRSDLSRRAIGHLSMRLAGTYAMHVFGKPERAVNCDCERVNSPTLLQSVFMQNDPLVEQRLAESGWIRQISEAEQAGRPFVTEDFIRQAWLRTVNRPPTDTELSRAQQHVKKCESVGEGVQDLLWALINTKEFLLNH